MKMKPANVSGQQIRKKRLQVGLTQMELAAALSVRHGIELEQSDVSEIERGKRGVKDFELVAISEVLGIPPAELLEGESQ